MIILENVAIGYFLLIPVIAAFVVSLVIARSVYHRIEWDTRTKWFLTIIVGAFSLAILLFVLVPAFGYFLSGL